MLVDYVELLATNAPEPRGKLRVGVCWHLRRHNRSRLETVEDSGLRTIDIPAMQFPSYAVSRRREILPGSSVAFSDSAPVRAALQGGLLILETWLEAEWRYYTFPWLAPSAVEMFLKWWWPYFFRY